MKTSRKTEKKKEQFRHLMSQINGRVWLLLVLIISVLTVLGFGILYRALSKNEEYSRKAMSQLSYTSTVKVAEPGDILDANLSPVATSYRVYILILDPKVIYATEKLYKGSLDATVELVAEAFELDEKEVREAIEKNSTSSYLRYGTKTVVSEEQKEYFEMRQEEINNPTESTQEGEEEKKTKVKVQGVWFDVEMRRNYPYGDLASKIIGFTTTDTTQGLWGLEKSYDSVLRGQNGRSITYLNEDSYLERSMSEPQNGYTLVSTIDMNLQRLISNEIDEWFAETDENGQLVNSAKSVSVLLMDPNTGAIKAFACDTDFDLNNPKDLSQVYSEEEIAVFKQNTEMYKAAKEKAQEEGTVFEWDSDAYPTEQDALSAMWRNGLISDSFEPGSTGKIPTFAAAIEEGVIDVDTHYLCSGQTQVANTNIKCHNFPKGGCGDIDSLTAVANSCNVAFIEIGQRLGREQFARYQEIFNFGQKTGVDLPGEASCEGLLYPEDQLNEVELVTNAFGQCYNVTMLQLAAAVASTINGGYYYKPYVVSQILDDDGNVVKNYEPTLVRQTVSEETSAVVRKAMRETVTEGTGYGVQVSDETLMEGISFIAKTGTAQKLPRTDNKYLISVISAAPEDHPTMLLYVVIDEYGGAKQADSEPAQYLSGDIWGAIKDYIGLYSSEDPGPEINQAGEGNHEAWEEGDSPMENLEGGLEDTPEPPEDDGSGSWNGIVVDPDSVINPEDTMPTLPQEEQES